MGDPESRSQFASRRSSRLLGVGDPESGSNFAAGLRRSPRLGGEKSAVIMSQSTQMASCKPGRIIYPKRHKPRKPKPKPRRLSFLCIPNTSVYFREGALQIGKFMRSMRKTDANSFRRAYAYDRRTSDRWDKITEKRFIVVSGRKHLFPNVGRSHGIMWVGVHGSDDSTCAVFLNEEPDMQCILDKLGDSFIKAFLKYVVSEMEDIADSPPYSDVIKGKPFAVVSVPDFSNNVDEESCHEEASAAMINAATGYLMRNICSSNSGFSSNGAEKIAISAFQRLCGAKEKFKADEIVVCTFHENDGDKFPWALTTSEVDSHLADIDQESTDEHDP